MNRITEKMIDAKVDYLNKLTKNNLEVWTDRKSNIGTYYVESAYGGHQLVQITNESGGCTPITYGFVSKRELYRLICIYINGVESTKKAAS